MPWYAALLFCLPLSLSAAQPEVAPEMRLTRVSEHVYYARGHDGAATEHQGFISNAGVVFGDDGILVFDSLGSPALARRLLALIRERSDLPLRAVVVSHYHADHIYGLQVFQEAGAQIIAPAGAGDYLASAAAAERLAERRLSLAPWVDDDTRLVRPDRVISRPEVLELGDLRMQLTPLGGAHSDGDLTLYVEPDRVLLSGDLIFEGRVPYLGDANTAAWLDILEQMQTRGLTALIPGHGPAANDPQAAIGLTRGYLARVRAVMQAAIEDLTPFDEAYAAADWSAWSDLPAFAATHRRNAYQVYLSLEAESLQ